MIEIVSATRETASGFTVSALGQSLSRLAIDSRWQARIAFENQAGLSAVYNARLLAADSPEHLVFVHDDVWIEDACFVDRITEALERFDIVGLAGNTRRIPRQPGWAFVDDRLQWDDRANLSGRVCHGSAAFGEISLYGPSPAACELLDGVLLAVRKSRLLAHAVTFDTRFDFHFYDLDLCRTARLHGLLVGTWPVSVTHQSEGSFGSTAWKAGLLRYREKWID